jgi:hypothetical protein
MDPEVIHLRLKIRSLENQHPELRDLSLNVNDFTKEQLMSVYANAVDYAHAVNHEKKRNVTLMCQLMILETIIVKSGSEEVSGITKRSIGLTSIQLANICDELSFTYNTTALLNEKYGPDKQFELFRDVFESDKTLPFEIRLMFYTLYDNQLSMV